MTYACISFLSFHDTTNLQVCISKRQTNRVLLACEYHKCVHELKPEIRFTAKKQFVLSLTSITVIALVQ